MLKLYHLANCDTCRRAVKWLQGRKITVEPVAIREHPPSTAELRAMLAARGGELRRLFNTSGRDYRDLNLTEKLPGMTDAQGIALLSKNGNLVKRPVLIGDGVALVGFDENEWNLALQE